MLPRCQRCIVNVARQQPPPVGAGGASMLMLRAVVVLLVVLVWCDGACGYYFRLEHGAGTYAGGAASTRCFVEWCPAAGDVVSVHWGSTGDGPLSFAFAAPDGTPLDSSTTGRGDRKGRFQFMAPPGEGGPHELCVTALPSDPAGDAVWSEVDVVVDRSDRDGLLSGQEQLHPNPIVEALRAAAAAGNAAQGGVPLEHLAEMMASTEKVLEHMDYVSLAGKDILARHVDFGEFSNALLSSVRTASCVTALVCAAVSLLQYRHLTRFVAAKKLV